MYRYTLTMLVTVSEQSGFRCWISKMVCLRLMVKRYDITETRYLTWCFYRVLAGTVDGRLFLVERGELKAIFFMQTLTEFDPNLTMSNPLYVRPRSEGDDMEIKFLLLVKNGLMFVANGCRVVYYKIQPDNKYVFAWKFPVVSKKALEPLVL